MSVSDSLAPEGNATSAEVTWSLAVLYDALEDDGTPKTSLITTAAPVAEATPTTAIASPADDGNKETMGEPAASASAAALAGATSPGTVPGPVIPAPAILAPAMPSTSAPVMISRGVQANIDEEEDDDEEVAPRIGPMLDLDGNVATMDTPRDQFKNDYDYLLLCENGETVIINFGHTERDKSFTAVREIKTSKKLIVDASPVFASALQRGWTETREQVFDIEITEAFNPDSWMRLLMVLRGGGAVLVTGDNGVRAHDDALVGWLHTYQLADYFQMDQAKSAVKSTMRLIMEYYLVHWKPSWERANMTTPEITSHFVKIGRERVRDLSAAVAIAEQMYPRHCPFSVDELVTWLFSACPMTLIVLCQNDLHDAICRNLALKFINQQSLRR